MSGLRVVFMGTPDFAVPALKKLIDAGHNIVAVYSQPPRPKGRGQQVQKSPVHETAEANGIPIYTPLKFKKNEEAIVEFRSLQADIAIVAAYGLILPQEILDAPRLGCINIHASLLPRWRGASPIQRAIWEGDDKTGVTIMKMELGLDTGDMLMKREVKIHETTTAQSLHDELSALGGVMIEEFMKNPNFLGEKQDNELSVYAPMLSKDEGLIIWDQDSIDIDRQVRALNPWPGTYTFLNGKRFRILEGRSIDDNAIGPGQIQADGTVGCWTGGYQITRLQPENAKAMDFQSAVNGHYLKIGESFS